MDQYADDSGPIGGDSVFNPRLVQMRAAHAAELQDPNLRSFAARALLHEGSLNGLANNFEQLSNYANARGMGIRQALNSGFYGPVNRGEIPSGLTQDQARAADAAIDSVFAKGRNKLAYRIDQGTRGDPNYATEQDPRFRPAKIDGNFFADHPEIAPGWAQKQLAADAAFKNGGGTIADQQFENGNPVAAINNAAGIKTPIGRGALSMAYAQDPNAPLVSGRGALSNGPGALSDAQVLLKGAQQNDNPLSVIGQGLSGIGASLAGISSPAQAAAMTAQAQLMQKTAADRSWSVGHVDPKTGMALATRKDGTMIQFQAFKPREEETKGEEEAAKLEAQAARDRYKTITEADAGADDKLRRLDQLETLIKDPNVYQGGLGNEVANAKNIVKGLGLANPEGVPETQLFNTYATQAQLERGKQLPGAVSNYEDQLMKTAGGLSLSNDRDANLAAIKSQRELLQYQKAIANEYRQARAEKGGLPGDEWDDRQAKFRAQYEKDHPVSTYVAPQAPAAAPITSGKLGPGTYVWTPKGMVLK